MESMNSIVVLGAGVAGLTTALVLARKGYQVTVIAQHLPGDLSIEYTSPWAGANWLSTANSFSPQRLYYSPAYSEREEEYDRITYGILWDLATNHPEAGVKKMSCLEYHEVPLSEAGILREGQEHVWFKDLAHDFRELSESELPHGVKAGLGLITVSINPQIYLPYLQSRLLELGTAFIRRHIFHIREAFTVPSTRPLVVINATGLLSCRLGGVEDKDVYPTRGQTILVRNDGGGTYLRNTSAVWRWYDSRWLPTSKQLVVIHHNDTDGRSSEVDPNLAQRIAVKCVALAPELTEGKGIEALDIVRHNVGLRPSRHGGPRLELENIEGTGLVVHNYGTIPLNKV